MGTFDCDCKSYHIPRHLLAFLLRHMPNLETLTESCPRNFELSQALVLLHQTTVKSNRQNEAIDDSSGEEMDSNEDYSTTSENNSSHLYSESPFCGISFLIFAVSTKR